jgi:tetratricopeptide (TPR) repeat protein
LTTYRRSSSRTHRTSQQIEFVPTHADAHFELGTARWQAGDPEGGLAECRIAVSLRPGWELAQVEIGIILIVAERYEEGRAHLEALYAGSPMPTTHLKFNLGSACWRCDALRDALVLLEEVLSDPSYISYPYALDQAAHCAFRLGDDKRGRAWAKHAHDLGCDTTYANWVCGAYRKSGR